MPLHEPAPKASWETKLNCTCGAQLVNWHEFYKHRGDAYCAEVERLQRIVDAYREAFPMFSESQCPPHRWFWREMANHFACMCGATADVDTVLGEGDGR